METPCHDRATADRPIDRRNRQADARLKLAFLKRHDRIVESYERLNSRGDLRRWQIDAWRETRRRQYRSATGVDIEQRDLLKARLQHIAATGDESIDQTIEALQRDYAKRSSLGEVGSEPVVSESP